jgi:hypothetical protein
MAASARLLDFRVEKLNNLFLQNQYSAPTLREDTKPCANNQVCFDLYKNYKTTCKDALPCKDGLSQRQLKNRKQAYLDCYLNRINYTNICCNNEIDTGHANEILSKYDEEQRCKARLEDIKTQKKEIKRRRLEEQRLQREQRNKQEALERQKRRVQKLKEKEMEEIQAVELAKMEIEKQKRLAEEKEYREKLIVEQEKKEQMEEMQRIEAMKEKRFEEKKNHEFLVMDRLTQKYLELKVAERKFDLLYADFKKNKPFMKIEENNAAVMLTWESRAKIEVLKKEVNQCIDELAASSIIYKENIAKFESYRQKLIIYDLKFAVDLYNEYKNSLPYQEIYKILEITYRINRVPGYESILSALNKYVRKNKK